MRHTHLLSEINSGRTRTPTPAGPSTRYRPARCVCPHRQAVGMPPYVGASNRIHLGIGHHLWESCHTYEWHRFWGGMRIQDRRACPQRYLTAWPPIWHQIPDKNGPIENITINVHAQPYPLVRTVEDQLHRDGISTKTTSAALWRMFGVRCVLPEYTPVAIMVA